VGKEVSNGPLNILLDSNTQTSFLNLGLKTGDRIEKRGKRLYFENGFEVDFEKAREWNPPKHISNILSMEKISQNIETIRSETLENGRMEGLGEIIQHVDTFFNMGEVASDGLSILPRLALPHIATLIKATLTNEKSQIKKASDGLIGLGLGLTPSGDDMLTGYMASIILVSSALKAKIDTFGICNSITSSIEDRTTLLSKQMLEYASQGKVEEKTYKVLEKLLTGSFEQVKRATLEIIDIGHSSGTDILLGVLLGTLLVKHHLLL
jgi:hypothetical protein